MYSKPKEVFTVKIGKRKKKRAQDLLLTALETREGEKTLYISQGLYTRSILYNLHTQTDFLVILYSAYDQKYGRAFGCII